MYFVIVIGPLKLMFLQNSVAGNLGATDLTTAQGRMDFTPASACDAISEATVVPTATPILVVG